MIPILLLRNNKVVKTVRFEKPSYIGEPINVVRVFNDKEVDELVILDISANQKGINYDLLEHLASEAFMPLTYGGGISSSSEIQSILRAGFEKVSLNSAFFGDASFVSDSIRQFGSQSIVASVDVKRDWRSRYKAQNPSRRTRPLDLSMHIENISRYDIGELLLTSIDRDGLFGGYDLGLISFVSSQLSIPLIACGGASTISDFELAVTTAGASAVAAGSMFVYIGSQRGILLNYPSREDLEAILP